METATLKAFAGAARLQLLKEVGARLDVVLAPGSTQRRERTGEVEQLEKAIGEAGGGDAGRESVVDRVAYTWFNRIIALRFMDANSFTKIPVVSPVDEHAAGQPEVLAEAKRGSLDHDVIASMVVVERVTGLLNGTITSGDPQSEAYGLLLAAYCRSWHKAMPFMFEGTGDYTELLMPADLLSDESVIAKGVNVLTPEVCRDVEVIGWLYQFYIADRKDEVFAGFKKGQKAGAAEIPAATQLFTPDWIVRYLVENSLGRLWLLNRPESDLANQMDYYIAPVEEETDFLTIGGPEDLKVMDPACGSGHMLTYAFDLLYAMYEEEGYPPAQIPGLILTKNLYGTEIDQRAGSLAAFALAMKARARHRAFFTKNVEPNICVLDPIHFTSDELDRLIPSDGERDEEEQFFNQFEDADIFGALIRPNGGLIPIMKTRLAGLGDESTLFGQDLVPRAERVVVQSEYLSCRYHVAVTNPPYMGSGNMAASLSERLAVEYVSAKSDLMTAFMTRSLELVKPAGYCSMINIPTWMFLKSYAALRRHLLASISVVSLVHLGRGVFGADFGSVAFTLSTSRATDMTRGVYRKLFDEHVVIRSNEEIESLFLLPEHGRYSVRQRVLNQLPAAQIAYWESDQTLDAFSGRPLTEQAQPMIGVQSGDNDLHYRYWYEVTLRNIYANFPSLGEIPMGKRTWVPLQRGGDRRRWYGNTDSVADFTDRGGAILATKNGSLRNSHSYFKTSVAWNRLSNGRFYPRLVDAGTVFDDLSPFVIPESGLAVEYVLGLLGSVTSRRFLGCLNQGRKTEVGQVAAIPLPTDEKVPDGVCNVVRRLVTLAREDWDALESSIAFEGSPLVRLDENQLETATRNLEASMKSAVLETHDLEAQNDAAFIQAYGLRSSIKPGIEIKEVTLSANPAYRFPALRGDEAASALRNDLIRSLVSYAVGCMFGRYSIDEPGLVLANQGDTLQEYLARIPDPSFMPDVDNVIPILADDWFDDDIIERFRLFLRVTFGEEHFEENLRFLEESLGKDMRKYFLTDFYKDHVKRYKKRPIYWMFSSPKGSFNALIYMHRYTPSTVSTVLNEYLREFQSKLSAGLENQERIAVSSASAREKARAEKEADKIRRMLAELSDYEHDVLYPLASQQIEIDLDDGVKANYPKFGTALKKIPGLSVAK